MSRRFTIKTALTDYFCGSIGETKLRELIGRGEIPHSRIGNKIILREEALDEWLLRKEKEELQLLSHRKEVAACGES